MLKFKICKYDLEYIIFNQNHLIQLYSNIFLKYYKSNLVKDMMNFRKLQSPYYKAGGWDKKEVIEHLLLNGKTGADFR